MSSFEHATLDNGLKIIAEVNPAAASLATGFFVRTGSRDETPDIAGVSHFLEHMVFKGTERRSAFDVNIEFDRMGANYNASTSEENTVYFATVLPEFQDAAVDLLGDLLRPSLRGDDFDMEKNVIVDEIARYEDMPGFRCYEKVMAAHFAGHPLGNSILGTPESIRALSREQMLAYFDSRYSPTNVTAVAVGNVNFETFVAKIEAMCGHWTPYDAPRDTPPARPSGGRHVVTDEKVNREHIALMSPAPSCQDDDRYAAHLAAAIVGDTTGSRLYYALIDPALADEACMTYDPLDRAGAFLTFISTDPERAGQVLGIVDDVCTRFGQEGPSEAELLAAKNKTATLATMKGERPMGRLTSVGFEWVYRAEHVPLADDIAAMFAVTRDDIRDVMARHDMTAATVLALGPLESL